MPDRIVGERAGSAGAPRSVRHDSGATNGRPRAFTSLLEHLPGSGPAWAVTGLVVLAAVVHGLRMLGPAYVGGDLLYHQALALSIVRDGLPPEGAYAGLPAYYPYGFHLLIAGLVGLAGLVPLRADQVLFVVMLPVLPAGTFLLARRATGRPWVAVLAVAFTLFGGAYDLNALRQWVNSLFLSGQAAYPEYPRDIVFALLPFAVWSFLRALDAAGASRAAAWAAISGAILGAAATVQIQLLLPLPFALAAAVAVVARDPARRRRAVAALLLAGAIAILIVAPWLVGTLDLLRRDGGGLDLSDETSPASFAFWSYAREFGLLLPLGILGAGVALLLVRRPDGPRPVAGTGRWAARPAEAGVLLAAWFALPFVLGMLYEPGWPLQDAVRPQRLWLLASQPMAILAAVGLATAAEHVLARRRPALVVPTVIAVLLVAALPATIATASVGWSTWRSDSYAMLDRQADRVPHFDTLLGLRGPRVVVLAPEDWSALAWFETGLPVVALDPPGFAKLAFDPAVMTGHGQAQRRADMVTAWSGGPGAMARIADEYDAATIVVPRDGDLWALFDTAVGALAPPAGGGSSAVAPIPGTAHVDGNGWDALDLAPGANLQLPWDASGRTLRVDLRVAGTISGVAQPARTLQLLGVTGAGERRMLAQVVFPAAKADWQRAAVTVTLQPGERLGLGAVEAIRVQAVRGWTTPAVPAGWHVDRETPLAVILRRGP